jgi:hypothetical protein
VPPRDLPQSGLPAVTRGTTRPYGLTKGLTLAATVAPFVGSPLLKRLDTYVDVCVADLLLAHWPRLREFTILGFSGGSVRRCSGTSDDDGDDDDDSYGA